MVSRYSGIVKHLQYSVELNSNNVPEKPGPSETAGMIFSIILLLVGITGVALSFIPRRD